MGLAATRCARCDKYRRKRKRPAGHDSSVVSDPCKCAHQCCLHGPASSSPASCACAYALSAGCHCPFTDCAHHNGQCCGVPTAGNNKWCRRCTARKAKETKEVFAAAVEQYITLIEQQRRQEDEATMTLVRQGDLPAMQLLSHLSSVSKPASAGCLACVGRHRAHTCGKQKQTNATADTDAGTSSAADDSATDCDTGYTRARGESASGG